MCLAIPGKVVEIRGDIAIIEYGQEKREAGILKKMKIVKGDYVLVQHKIIISKLNKKQAEKTLAAFEAIK